MGKSNAERCHIYRMRRNLDPERNQTSVVKRQTKAQERKQHSASISSNKACLFCDVEDTDELHLGELHNVGTIRAHYYCLLFSSGLQQRGKTDDQGIKGFMPKDIFCELKRGRRLRCSFCRQAGATIGCIQKKCPRAFHLPCGLKNEVMLQFYESFPAYCKNHRLMQRPMEWKELPSTCSICMDDVNTEVSTDTLYPPCCTNGWFHRDCLQRNALISGYFFKCPLCNNQKEFKAEMETYGLYIPEQDAAWEREQGAFSDLYTRYAHCDAEPCLCPDGRDRDDEEKPVPSPWEIFLCQSCGSQGTHFGCSKLPYKNPRWNCPQCTDILTKSGPPVEKKPRKSLPETERHIRRQPSTRSLNPKRRSGTRGMRRKKRPPPSTDSSRSSSPCADDNKTKKELSSSSNLNSFYRQRHASSSSSDSCDKLPVFRLKRESSNSDLSNQDPAFDSPGNAASQTAFTLKRPALTFNSESNSNHFSDSPERKLYSCQTSANPFSTLANPSTSSLNTSFSSTSSRNHTSNPTKVSLREYASGKELTGTVFIGDSSDDDDVMPILTPITQGLQNGTKTMSVINVSSDSDDGKKKPVVDNTKIQRVGNRIVYMSSSDEETKPKVKPETSSSGDEVIIPDQVQKSKKITKGKFSQPPVEDTNNNGQLSILKYMPNNNNNNSQVINREAHSVPFKRAPRKRVKNGHSKTISPNDCSLKITSFFQVQTKAFVIKYSDEDDDD